MGWRAAHAISWQFTAIVVVWAYMVSLFITNDGLWFQGDAPRHLANGVFWLDLITELPSDPKAFALGYYARYPVIHPAVHPPGFYVLEALAFAIFGASPLVAKVLVLLFALVAAVYLNLWLRRSVDPLAGWAALLLLLQPGVILWSHTVMLNTPSMALGLAALWHMRQWLDAPASRHVYPAMLLTLAGTLTYMTTGVVILIFAAWLLTERRWAVLKDRRAWLLAPVLMLILAPWIVMIVNWAPTHLVTVYQTNKPFLRPSRWTYYAGELPRLFTPMLLWLAALGAAVGLTDRHHRRFTVSIAVWCVVCYLGFSYLITRDGRYIMHLGPPAVLLTAIGIWSLSRRAATRLSVQPAAVFLPLLAVITGVHFWIASSVTVPRAHGFKEIAAFFKEVAPEEAVLYDGIYDGVFSLYTRLGDPGFKRSVVVGDKLLYANAIFTKLYLSEFVSSPAEVVKRMQTVCGCRWVAIENSSTPVDVKAAKYLREAVKGPEFEFVRTFKLDATRDLSVDVYRLLLPVESRDQFELHFPNLGGSGQFRAKPIER